MASNPTKNRQQTKPQSDCWVVELDFGIHKNEANSNLCYVHYFSHVWKFILYCPIYYQNIGKEMELYPYELQCFTPNIACGRKSLSVEKTEMLKMHLSGRGQCLLQSPLCQEGFLKSRVARLEAFLHEFLILDYIHSLGLPLILFIIKSEMIRGLESLL